MGEKLSANSPASDTSGKRKPVLAFDLGGTKIAAALVCQGRIIEHQTAPTESSAGPDEWVDNMAQLAQSWSGQFSMVGAAVTGRIEKGLWSALNTRTLNIPDRYPLLDRLHTVMACPVMTINDAQAAAWGEFCHGAGYSVGHGAGKSPITDLVFITVSTGIGGGIVLGGKLIYGHTGLAGSIGQIPSGIEGEPWENQAAGRWFAQAAASKGWTGSRGECGAAEVFAAATDGDTVAEELIQQSARQVARLCETLQAVLDPAVVVLGGGIGLGHGFLEQVKKNVNAKRPCTDVHLVPAVLGGDAGLIGVAELAMTEFQQDQQPKG